MDFRHKRKQAAGSLVMDGFFSTGKKTTAQPRPVLQIPPRGIGPITEPNKNDVLCGRGGRINAHDGNVQFREIVAAHKKEYLSKSTKKLEKAHIAARLIQQIRTMDPPGRFLKEDTDTGLWFDIGDAKAIKKAGQALREDAPEIRPEGDDDNGENSDRKEAEKKTTNTNAPNKKTIKAKKTPITKSPGVKQPSAARVANSGGQGIEQNVRNSWNTNSSSSTFGMPFPQDSQQQQTANSGFSRSGFPNSFPSTASTGSKGNPLFLRNMGVKFGSMSKKAMEIMHFHQAQAQAQQQFQQPHPDEVAFGRGFTPTEISGVSGASMLSGVSKNTMSTISGLSGLTTATGSNMGGSQFGAKKSALTGTSSGTMGPPVHPVNNSALHSLHLSNLTTPMYNSSKDISDLTNCYMSYSGLQRSPSFEELPNNSLGDALAAEDKQVADVFEKTMPPRYRGVARATSSAMSVQSTGSSVMTDNSWMNTYGRIAGNRYAATGSVSSQGSATMKTGSSLLWPGDDRSIMSDVSESILALDLASSHH
mmetsp:Transcript_25332/g.37404  ORF Transcript_25332/g.37404 Transcript_25332/m.37404 type:complete len:534 (-) Transcript_25332:243-1844(-)|eukprot:CAMPEP_0194227500 /NCGR_PEP_ID=MMETSP0156-20130528/42887_1 /TAXON_ID=33649 /ORGANISM="Thalassionema nitzschioides, Strain L26-B" /LENGTH=533 /DNA_ID=CAMNT_0038959983 /DNA_START=977 /DNA_END=2578 /DNA_ORIENTATION=+